MKKISLLLAALGATVAFTACQDSADDHPTLGKTEGQVVDFLNVPADLSAPVSITELNKNSIFALTCTQPKEYGFQAPVTYEVEVSLSEDFETPKVEGCPASIVLGTSFNNVKAINPPYEEVAKAICKILNIQKSDQIPTAQAPLYMRLIANVTTTSGLPYEGTSLVSNTIKYEDVSVGYLAIIIPGVPSGVYIMGGMNGWSAKPQWEFLSTTEENVYEIDDCTIAKGTEFKIADANWDKVNFGLGEGALKFNAPYSLTPGGDSKNIVMPADFSGSVRITLKGNSCTIFFDAAEPDTPGIATGIYIKGDLNGWSNDPACEFLTTDIKNVKEIADITIPAGNFKVADANWGPLNLGSNGEPIEPGVPYKLTPGGDSGNIVLEATFVGSASLRIKGNNYYLTLTPAD